MAKALLGHGVRLCRGGHADARAASRQSGPAYLPLHADRAVINRLGFNNRAMRRRLSGSGRARAGWSASISGRGGTLMIASPTMSQASSALPRSPTISPSTSPRPTRRACAISRLRKRSTRCSRGSKRRAKPCSGRSPPLLLKLAPDLADARPARRSCASTRPMAWTASSCRTPRLPATGSRTQASRPRRAGCRVGRSSPVDALACPRLYAHRREAAADRRRRHRFRRDGAGQDRGGRLALAALYRARLRGTVAHRPHQAGAGAGD